MIYDNSSYWQNIHQQYADQLRAVGHPWLSEKFNQLKYQSEADTTLSILSEVKSYFFRQKTIKILDIGAGTGYWTFLVGEWFKKEGFEVDMHALDISVDALKAMKERMPWINPVYQDLKTVAPDLFREQFDLVYPFYCLHHLTNLDDFLNGLRFTGRSVRKAGIMIYMDPVLTRPYSIFDTIDFPTYQGNGIPRHLYLIDNVMQNEGLRRVTIKPAISYLLNGNIEADSRQAYRFHAKIWHTLQKWYADQEKTRQIENWICRIDKRLKSQNKAFSSSVVVYQKY